MMGAVNLDHPRALQLFECPSFFSGSIFCVYFLILSLIGGIYLALL